MYSEWSGEVKIFTAFLMCEGSVGGLLVLDFFFFFFFVAVEVMRGFYLLILNLMLMLLMLILWLLLGDSEFYSVIEMLMTFDLIWRCTGSMTFFVV